MNGEMDARIEKLVFGGDVIQCPRNGIWGYRWNGTDDVIDTRSIPMYSRDIAAAMRLFEAMVEMTGAGSISADMEDARGEGFIVGVSFGFDEQHGTADGPLPEAVCRAALAIVDAAMTREVLA